MTIHIFGDSYADPMPHEQENAWYDMLDEEVSSKQGVSNVFLRNHLLYKNHIILSDIIKKFFNNDRNFPEFFTVDQIIDEPYIYE